jgi:hypothetical protein
MPKKFRLCAIHFIQLNHLNTNNEVIMKKPDFIYYFNPQNPRKTINEKPIFYLQFFN